MERGSRRRVARSSVALMFGTFEVASTADGVTMRSFPKAVTVMAGARDHFQLALALAEAGHLAKLVTDVYAPLDRWPALDARWLHRRGLDARKRFAAGLPSSLVVADTKALLCVLMGRFMRSSAEVNRRKDCALSRRALRETLRLGAVLFAYSYYAAPAFRELATLNLPRLLFQVHPHPGYLRKLFAEELERVPAARASLRFEHEMMLRSDDFRALCDEPALATAIVVASTFTARSLTVTGTPPDRVRVVPYGVDAAAFAARTARPYAAGPLRVIFVGSLTQRKGLSYLLDAVKQIGPTGVRLTCCTRGFVDTTLLEASMPSNVEIHTDLSHSDLLERLWSSDLFVLPSLAEGFGHVIAEAMASGLPVITTANSAGPDLIRHQTEGFIIPIRDSTAMAALFDWGLNNRSTLFDMGQAAATTIQRFTWPRFREGIRLFYREFASESAAL